MARMTAKRILYIQYTNPGGYPPLEHSSRILADRGWEVLFIGIEALGAVDLKFPAHARIKVRLMKHRSPGLLQKIHYLAYCGWAALWAWGWKPDWIYASDPLSAPAALMAGLVSRAPIICHEHDSPFPIATSSFLGAVLKARGAVARKARVNVIPAEGRIREFRRSTSADPASILCVWNCPGRGEAEKPVAQRPDGNIWIYYHGSINSQRLPISVVDALGQLPDRVGLRIVGYETSGSVGHVNNLLARASELGIDPHRMEYLGPAVRAEMLDAARKSDIGLAFMPAVSDDLNMTCMVGASNKPFEYMACGLPFLVSNQADWLDRYVTPGYALACDPVDPGSIAAAVRTLLSDADAAKRMGMRGRQQILDEWNYETQFRKVVAILEEAK